MQTWLRITLMLWLPGLVPGGNSVSAEVAPVQVDLEWTSGRLTVADEVTLVIRATVPKLPLETALETGRDEAFSLEPPEDALRRLDGLRLIDAKEGRRTLPGARFETRHSFRFEPMRPGPIEVPALNLVFWPDRKEGKTPLVIRTEPAVLEILSMVEGDPFEAKLRPPAPVLHSGWARRTLGVFVIVGILAFAWWRYRTLPGRETPTAPASAPPGLRERAMTELEGANRPSQLLEVLNRYVNQATATDFPRFNVEEVRRSHRLGPADQSMLLHLLEDLEAAIYGQAGRETPQLLRERIRQFIKTTQL